jgi:nucleotide-binding universal stress UspA family protein
LEGVVVLKDILVHIPMEGSITPVVDCAVSLAAVFQSNLEAVAFDYQLLDGPGELDGDVVGEIVEDISGTEQAVVALDKFAAAAKASGISWSVRKIDISGKAGEMLARLSRLYDLTIIRQHDATTTGYDDNLAETVLLNSGRPILLVPYTFAGRLQIKRALVCWDGGKAAARAVHDAMPLLGVAESIKVIGINEQDSDAPGTSSRALADHLARHKLSTEIERFDVGVTDIPTAILSTAADYAADIIVMGGYGHSSILEHIRGGVTRATFKSLTTPVLMSH